MSKDANFANLGDEIEMKSRLHVSFAGLIEKSRPALTLSRLKPDTRPTMGANQMNRPIDVLKIHNRRTINKIAAK